MPLYQYNATLLDVNTYDVIGTLHRRFRSENRVDRKLNGDWQCDCELYRYQHKCQHIDQVIKQTT